MDNDDREDRRFGSPDRRVESERVSAFNDPRFWVSVTSVLLTLSIFIFGFIATQLISINAKVGLADLANTRQDERVKVLEDENRRLRSDIEGLKQVNVDKAERDADYRFKLGNDLTEIKTRLGMPLQGARNAP